MLQASEYIVWISDLHTHLSCELCIFRGSRDPVLSPYSTGEGKKKTPSVNFSYCFINEIVLLSPGSMTLPHLSSGPKGCLDDGISKAKGKNFTF